jgi:hypothetical protein
VHDLIRRLVGRPVGRVEVCERHGEVCDDRCRADILLDQARTRAATARLGLR